MAESDDDSSDSISLTSTVASSLKDSYPVDDILAERIDDSGEKHYLIQWEGYSLDRCTWEPPENFVESEDVTNDETFREWEAKKLLIAQGAETAFDVVAWERNQVRLAREKQVRQAKRRVKKRRLGRRRQDGSFSENQKRPKSPYRGTSKADAEENSDSRAPKKRKTSASENTMKPVAPEIKANTSAPAKKGIARTKSIPSVLPTEKRAEIIRERRFAAKFKSKTKPKASMKSAPSGPPKVSGAAVLENWDKDLKRKKWGLGDSWHEKAGGMDKHRFNNMSMQHRFALYGKNEPQPDVNQLKFLDLKDGKPLKDAVDSPNALKGKQHKNPYAMIQEKLAEEKLAEQKEAENAREAKQQLAKETEERTSKDSGRKPEVSSRKSTNERGPKVQEESLFVDPVFDEPLSLDIKHGHATETQAGNDSVDVDMQDAPLAGPHTAADRTGARPFSAPKDSSVVREKRDVAEHTDKAVDALKDLRSIQKLDKSSSNQPFELQAPSEGSFTTASRGIGPTRELGESNPPRTTNQEMPEPTAWPLHRLTGDTGQWPKTDVYGALTRKGRENAWVMFRGLMYNVKGLFLLIKKPPREFNVEMHMFCSESEYMEKYHNAGNIYYGAGHILPKPHHESYFDEVSEELRAKACGAMFFSAHFSVLVYPTGSPSWHRFDNQFRPGSPRSQLRFYIRTPIAEVALSQAQRSEIAPTTSSLQHSIPPRRDSAHRKQSPPASPPDQKPSAPPPPLHGRGRSPWPPPPPQYSSREVESPREPKSPYPPQSPYPTRSPYEPSSPGRPQLSRMDPRLAGRRRSEMSLPQESSSVTPVGDGLTAFVKEVDEANRDTAKAIFERQFHVDFKLLSQFERPTDRQPHYFLHFPITQKAQHDALSTFLRRVGLTPYSNLEKGEWDLFAKNKQAGVVLIHESTESIHQIPHLAGLLWKPTFNFWQFGLSTNTIQEPAFTPMFPRGGTVLILDSVFVNDPGCLVRLISWFRKHQEVHKPKQYKLAFRPRVREFLQSLAVTNMDVAPERGGAFRAAFVELDKLAPLGMMDPLIDPDYETPKDDAPYWSPQEIKNYELEAGLTGPERDASALQKNDQLLVDRYGRWTTGQFMRYRKFCVIYNGHFKIAEQWRGDWRHISVDPHNKLFKGLGVDEWDMPAAQRQKQEREKRRDAEIAEKAAAHRKRTG